MKVYLVRHGETVGNRKGFHQVPETPLTKTGIVQTKMLAKRLKNLGIELIYSSTHLRAHDTSLIISKEINTPLELWGKLVEIKRPFEISGKSTTNPEVNKIERLIIENFGNKDWKYSDEENFFDLKDRTEAVLSHLLTKHKDQTILCVSHGTFIKFLVSTAIFGDKLTPEIFNTMRRHFWAENTGVSMLEYREDRGWRLNSWNDTTHL